MRVLVAARAAERLVAFVLTLLLLSLVAWPPTSPLLLGKAWVQVLIGASLATLFEVALYGRLVLPSCRKLLVQGSLVVFVFLLLGLAVPGYLQEVASEHPLYISFLLTLMFWGAREKGKEAVG